MFEIDIFASVIKRIENSAGISYEDNKLPIRVIADHLRAAVFMISEGILPSNEKQGFILRRLLKRAMIMVFFYFPVGAWIGVRRLFVEVAKDYIYGYKGLGYFENGDLPKIRKVITEEVNRFGGVLKSGIKVLARTEKEKLNTQFAFDLYQSYGVPEEEIERTYSDKGVDWDQEGFDLLRKKHSELSRSTSAGTFKGGLGDKSEKTTWYHTLTHLLHKALRDVLGEEVHQAGSNITPERLRFDFTFDRALTKEEVTQVEKIVNEQKNRNLEVTMESMPLQKALDSGAMAFFKEKYAATVSVYTIGDYSKEICGGPHVKNTSEIKGTFKIVKEESSGAGVRRIRAVVE